MSLSKEKNYLLYLLAKQDYSRKQLFDKLISRGNIPITEIISLLDEFEQNKWLCDERFARVFISSEVANLRGKKRIINTAVYQKGLLLELVESCLEDQEIDWFELCQQCLDKKYKDINKLQADFKLRQKAINYLIYNGFSFDEINFALSKTSQN
ncbi:MULTISPECIES: regulatory protein RecX [Francisella]|uniref:Regulatory protein RecX n=1 Tax=Francisella opportunistica TaxID=2016517 RepID=A0A345JPB9_9GAMM|nr:MULTISPECIES: regulatory protein RecX [Francisella]APC90829.1 Regulatory protein RecX [Francisella sp. MA067296]AXH29165.1 regulatory protein RecX [Francisella opportunistica]AXH30816.1 RecX family transcriptional regulator [Francisella opportunistica]AXH32461.1 RecX family transcriptional regulator [Francisella opportunistica]